MTGTTLELDSPVLLARLRRAREDRGISQEEAARAMGLARTTLVAIEAGQRGLRAEELFALAGLYDESLERLLRAAPPPRGLAAQFRSQVGRLPQEKEVRAATRALQALAEDYLELEDLLNAPLLARHPPARELGRNQEQEAERLALEERRRLALGDGPLPHLRGVLENDVGMRIFSLRLPSRISGLFGFDEELGACVAMNADQPWERQRWSLAHEYAHFLTRRYRAEVTVLITTYERVPASERFADAFARHFLLPEGGVRRRLHAATEGMERPTTAVLLQQADWWGVSFEAYVRRAEGLRLIRPGAFDRLSRKGFKVEEGRELLDLPRHPADARLLPRRFRLLAVNAYSRGLISEERLAGLLRENRVGARRAAAELSEYIAEDG